MDKTLNWKSNINEIANKARKRANVLKYICGKIILFKTYLRSIII